MLHRVKALKGDPIIGDDGDVGSIDDLYFDARRWGVCFLVVATGPWGIGRKLMISPSSVERSSPDARMRVRMTREQVEGNPEVEARPGSGPDRSHLVSSAELTGYGLEAPDGEIGHVEPPTAIAEIDRPAKKVRVRLTREEVRNSPEADGR